MTTQTPAQQVLLAIRAQKNRLLGKRAGMREALRAVSRRTGLSIPALVSQLADLRAGATATTATKPTTATATTATTATKPTTATATTATTATATTATATTATSTTK